jgi:hypothetical protein
MVGWQYSRAYPRLHSSDILLMKNDEFITITDLHLHLHSCNFDFSQNKIFIINLENRDRSNQAMYPRKVGFVACQFVHKHSCLFTVKKTRPWDEQWTLELRPAWHTNNLGYNKNFSFDLRPKSWVTTRMPVKATWVTTRMAFVSFSLSPDTCVLWT